LVYLFTLGPEAISSSSVICKNCNSLLISTPLLVSFLGAAASLSSLFSVFRIYKLSFRMS